MTEPKPRGDEEMCGPPEYDQSDADLFYATEDSRTLRRVQAAAAACGFTDAESQAHPEQVIRALADTVGEREAELEWIYTNWPELREAVRIGRAPLAINPGSS